MRTIPILLFGTALTLVAAVANAQGEPQNQPTGGGFSIEWYTMDSGGTLFAAGGDWKLAGTLGQFDASGREALAGGNWSWSGGFWADSEGVPGEPVIFSDRFEQ